MGEFFGFDDPYVLIGKFFGYTVRSNIARAQKWVGHYWGAAARGQRGHGGYVVSSLWRHST